MAIIETLGASHLATEHWDVQRTNNFQIQIEGVTPETRTLILSIASGFLPTESNEVINLSYGNTTVTVAGAINFHGSGSLVIRDIVEKDIEGAIDTWRSKVADKETDAVHLVHNYKMAGKIIQYASDGTMIRTWDVEGLWPSAVDYGQLSYEGSSVKTISVTLQYDKCRINRKDFNLK